MLTNEKLEMLATPKPHRKGDTEEHIYAENQKTRTSQALIASLKKAKELGSSK